MSFIYLRDQIPISQEQYEEACSLLGKIDRMIERRKAYIDGRDLNPSIHLPMGNWAGDRGLFRGLEALLTCDYNVINNLRLFSQVFTGYQLLSMKAAAGLPFPQSVPEELDEFYAFITESADPWVERTLRIAKSVPADLWISPVPMMGEVGWVRDGRIVNHDVCVYFERLALLYESGILDREESIMGGPCGPWCIKAAAREDPRILEIGGGYGGLAYYLMKLVPSCTYVLIDLPESLGFSAVYLSTLFGRENVYLCEQDEDLSGRIAEGRINLVPNYFFDQVVQSEIAFDLVINTLSMSEMTEAQVEYYCRGIVRLLNEGGVFFEQNQDNRPVGFINAPDLISSYFSRQKKLRGKYLPGLTQGKASVWTPLRLS